MIEFDAATFKLRVRSGLIEADAKYQVLDPLHQVVGGCGSHVQMWLSKEGGKLVQYFKFRF